MKTKKLLINWVYYHAIGHTIEALRYAQNYRNANPDLFIAVALNARAGVELARCVPGIDAVYPIRVEPFEHTADRSLQAPWRAELEKIPAEWDYVLVDPRHTAPMGWEALDSFEREFQRYIRAGVMDTWTRPVSGFPGGARGPLALHLPETARQFAKNFLNPGAKTRISILFGSGSEACRTPPMLFWQELFPLLFANFPGLEIILLGAFSQNGTSSRGVSQEDVELILRRFPQARSAFDQGLLNQLAIAERCSLHISPHTGMSFAVQCVGVPWLALSGGDCAENIVNGVPFISIYPDCERYPCGRWFAPEKNPMLLDCEQRRRLDQVFLCLSEERLRLKLPQILDSARLLVNQQRPYLECVRSHYQAMLPRLGKKDGDPFLDGFPDVLSESFVFRNA